MTVRNWGNSSFLLLIIKCEMGYYKMAKKKNILTYAGLTKLEKELEDLKVNKRAEVAEKIKEAREQGDLSENAEYDAAKDENEQNHGNEKGKKSS